MMSTPGNKLSKEEISAITTAVLDALDARSRDIVRRRYGLQETNAHPETLESIGREYGITRERVRQIQSQAKRNLRDKQELFTALGDILNHVFQEHGGIIAESDVAPSVARALGETEIPTNVVVFYLDVLPGYVYDTRDTSLLPHWRHPDFVNEIARSVPTLAEDVLKQKSHPITQDELVTAIRDALADRSGLVPPAHLHTQLNAARSVQQTVFGEWGLTSWAETTPRGVGDKAYTVLRRAGKPQHFTQITDAINEASFDHKTANPQTVHNELIKDSRFVLVGRGLYGLTEWGYISGTVADVIEELLKKAARPLSREEVIEQVMEQRQVKKNTIVLGLQNQGRFARTEENKYTLASSTQEQHSAG